MMAGLGAAMKPQQQMQPPQRAPQDAEAPEQDDEAGEEQANVSPEEQAIYEQVVRNGLELIYPQGEDAGISPQVKQGLSADSGNPIVNLATTAVVLITGLRDSAKKAGSPIPDEILYHAGTAIIEELAEVAEATKIHDYSEDDIEQAFYTALDMYRASATQTGDADPEQMKQGFEAIKQADSDGTLGQLLPGIETRMKGN